MFNNRHKLFALVAMLGGILVLALALPHLGPATSRQEGAAEVDPDLETPAASSARLPPPPDRPSTCDDLLRALLAAFGRGDFPAAEAANRELAADCPDRIEPLIDGALELNRWPEPTERAARVLVEGWPPRGWAALLMPRLASRCRVVSVDMDLFWGTLGQGYGGRIVALLRALPGEDVEAALRKFALSSRTSSERLALLYVIYALQLEDLSDLVFWTFGHEDEDSRVAALRALGALRGADVLLQELLQLYVEELGRQSGARLPWRFSKAMYSELAHRLPMDEAIGSILSLVLFAGNDSEKNRAASVIEDMVESGTWPFAEYTRKVFEIWPDADDLGKGAMLRPFYDRLDAETADRLFDLFESESAGIRSSILAPLSVHEISAARAFDITERAILGGGPEERAAILGTLTVYMRHRDRPRARKLLDTWLGTETDDDLLEGGIFQLQHWAADDPEIMTLLEGIRANHADARMREAAADAIRAAREIMEMDEE